MLLFISFIYNFIFVGVSFISLHFSIDFVVISFFYKEILRKKKDHVYFLGGFCTALHCLLLLFLLLVFLVLLSSTALFRWHTAYTGYTALNISETSIGFRLPWPFRSTAADEKQMRNQRRWSIYRCCVFIVIVIVVVVFVVFAVFQHLL